MSEIIKFKLFRTTEDFQRFQINNDINVINITPHNVQTKQDSSDYGITNTEFSVGCFVTYTDNCQKSFGQLEDLVINWAEEKGILANGTPIAQANKTLEEAQEIKDAIKAHDGDEIADGIGDTLVTLIIQAHMQDLDIVECLHGAYNIISKRTGQMRDGAFIKDDVVGEVK